MEMPVIVFILLFILVIILILLHKSNKKYADKISILEQTLNMKVDALTSLKATYAEAKEAIDKHASQENMIALQAQKIQHYTADKEQLIQTLKEKENQIKQQQSEQLNILAAHTKDMNTMHQEMKKKSETYAIFKKEFEDKLLDIESDKQTLENTIKEQKREIEALESAYRKEIEKQQNSADDIKNILSKKEKEYKALEKTKQELSEIVSKRDAAIQKQKESYRLLNQKFEALQETLEEQKQALEKVIEMKDKENHTHNETIEALAKKQEEEQQILEQTRNEIKMIEKEFKTYQINAEQTFKEYELRIAQKENHIAQSEKNSKLLMDKINTLSKKLKKNEEKGEQTKVKYTLEMEEIKKENIALKNAQKRLDKEKDKLEKMLNENKFALEQEKHQSEYALEKAKREREHIEEKYESSMLDAQQKYQNYLSEIQKLEETIATFNEQRKETSKHLKTLEMIVSEKEKEIINLNAKEKKYKESIAKASQQISHLSRNLLDKEKEIASLEDNYEAIGRKHQKSLEEYKRELISQKERQSKAIEVYKHESNSLKEQIEMLEERLQFKTNTLAEQNKTYESIIRRLNKQKEALEGKLAEYTMDSAYQNMEKKHGMQPQKTTMLSLEENVLHFFKKGMNKKELSKKFNIPQKRIELIVKFSKLKDV